MTMLEKVAEAIAKCSEIRAFGLYDYSHYPAVEGGLKAHVVRDEHAEKGKIVFESDSPNEARKFYEAASRRFVARAALEAIREPEGVPFTNEVVDCEGGWETPRTVWRDTINAILAEGSE